MGKAINNGKSFHEVIQPGSRSLTVLELTPHSDWSEMNESEHFVQFYEADEFLLNSLSGFIRTGLVKGDACIVVSTKAHSKGLEERLQATGLDVAAASASGQYVWLDAAETLSKFMVDGMPDPDRFAKLIGDIIVRAANGRRQVRIFGEMVALLWRDGNCDAVIRLEELWNGLRKTQSFLLFCAYPMNNLGGEAFAEPLKAVCTEHARLIPAESYTALADRDDRLRAIIMLQQKARSLQAEIAEREKAEEALRAAKDELEVQIEDLRRLHEMNEQLLIRERMARAEAERANRLKDEFLATISHELRTPLTSIVGWSHMLRNGRLNETAVARAVETIERNASAQAQLVEDILDMSRVITGKLCLEIERVNVASVINAAVDSVLLAAHSKGIRIEVIQDPSVHYIAGDSNRLQQIVWNLLSNAIKFTSQGGHVEVRLARIDSDVQISVSDTGEGIRSDFIPFIFDRFRQADSTSTRRHGGLGLGLAIVRQLVELHGGTVHADSLGEGCGATFTIRLPLAVLAESATSQEGDIGSLRLSDDATAHCKQLPLLDGIEVLLVDDDRDTLQMLTFMLTEYKAKVQTAASAAEALETLLWYKPDVLISDVAMPGEDGYSLIRKVRAREAGSSKQTPALALTAYVRVEDRARTLSAGFDMFVPKPVELNELIIAIANLVEPGTPKFERTETVI